MIFKAVVVDDEKLALELISDYVEKTPFLSLQASFRDSFSAINYLNSHQVDLLLLDINMPSLNGIDLVSSLPNPPKIVFITAHPDYALQGFELNALDYLVKPVRYPQFLKAANKLVELNNTAPVTSITKDPAQVANDNYIFVKVDNRYERILLADITFIEAYGDYVTYHLKQGKWLSFKTMAQALTNLPTNDFIRVHRSYIVNLRHVDTIHRDHLLIGEKDIVISKSYYKGVKSRLTN